MASKSKSQNSKDISAFRAAHDKSFIIPQKIKAAITKLGESGWEYEAAFIKMAEICQADMGRFRDEFKDFIVVVERTKRVWCGSKQLATTMRKMVS